MAKRTTRNVDTQMGGGFTTRNVGVTVGPHKAVLGYAVGKGKQLTPTQTAPAGTLPTRAGTKQYKYGKSDR